MATNPEDIPRDRTRSQTHTQIVAERVIDGDIPGVKSGKAAMAASGAQSEFIAHNILQAQALKSALILRAGDPPQYNKYRSPKSGVNLTKTSKQGFFKGALSKEQRFARLEDGRIPKPHNEKDAAHLALKATDPDYQHVMQLDINMRDIIREVSPEGDLTVLGFNQFTGQLRLGYKEGCGPKTDSFDGQFVINLNIPDETPQFFSRPWDKPEADRNWDPETQVIRKPIGLELLPDDVYQEVFKFNFKVSYSETKSSSPDDLKPAEVFANRQRNAAEFKETIDLLAESNPQSNWPNIKQYIEDELESKGMRIEDVSLSEVITFLTEKADLLDKEAELKTSLPGYIGDADDTTFNAEAVIKAVYNKGGSIVAGDWDGMALGHPPDLKDDYKKVFNTFASGGEGVANKAALLKAADSYLDDIKAQASLKEPEHLSAFEKKALSLSSMISIVSEFALARAGCITAHEFLFEQVLNHAYRDEANAHYGEDFGSEALQVAMDQLLKDHASGLSQAGQYGRVCRALKDALPIHPITDPLFDKMASHLNAHLTKAIQDGSTKYTLPHMDHDMNVHDLYQHGFDMRNPYGSNLEGPWLLVAPDGGVLYGDTQEQLIDVMLTGNFLNDNLMDISHGADMNAGWDKVIAKQIELGQTIPDKTQSKYDAHLALNALNAGKAITPVSSDVDMSLGWDKVIEKQLALSQAIEPDVQSKFDAHAALQSVKAGDLITPVSADANLSLGWDKVIATQIEKGHEADINPATLAAYKTHIEPAPDAAVEADESRHLSA